jgi:ferredoxin
MRIKIDGGLCSGHGRCNILADDVYRLDDDGYNADRGSTVEVPPEREASALLGLQSCPEAAIRVVE